MRARVSGRIEVDDQADLSIDGETSDLVATDDLFVRVRRALGNAEAHPTGFLGSGSFRGKWLGTTSLPVFEGRFTGRDVGYSGIDWGQASWTGTLDTGAEAVDTRSLVLRKGDGELRWAGRSEIGWYGVRDAIEGELLLSRWPVADVVSFMEWEADLTGEVSGEARARGRRSAPEGEASVNLRGGRYFGVPYDEARGRGALGRPPGRGDLGAAEVRGGHDDLHRQPERRRHLRRTGRGEGRRSRRAPARPGPRGGLRGAALRPARSGGNAHPPPAAREPQLAPSLPRATRASGPSRRPSSAPATGACRSTAAAARGVSTSASPDRWGSPLPSRPTWS